ncbi:MAG: tetratricopeptide repeat protein [Planctomycetales bacterium]
MPRREQLEALLESDPDDVFLNYALAKELIAEGRAAEGLACFDRVIELDPNYVPAYFQKGQALAERGEVAAAREALTAGIAAARRTGDTHALGEMTGFLEALE